MPRAKRFAGRLIEAFLAAVYPVECVFYNDFAHAERIKLDVIEIAASSKYL